MSLKSTETMRAFPIIIWLVFLVTAAYGWFANIIKLVDMMSDPVTGEMVLRIVGIPFGPLGVVMGLFI